MCEEWSGESSWPLPQDGLVVEGGKTFDGRRGKECEKRSGILLLDQHAAQYVQERMPLIESRLTSRRWHGRRTGIFGAGMFCSWGWR